MHVPPGLFSIDFAVILVVYYGTPATSSFAHQRLLSLLHYMILSNLYIIKVLLVSVRVVANLSLIIARLDCLLGFLLKIGDRMQSWVR